MPIRQQHISRWGARERLQEEPGEEPAHHLLQPSCARPDPPKRTQIKAPSPRRHIPKGNHGEPSIPRRNLSGEGSGREATGAVAGRNRRSPPLNEERGTARSSGSPSLHTTSLSWPRLKIPVMRWNGMRRGRAGGEASTSAVSLNSTNLTAPPSPVQVQPWECKRTVL